MPVLVRKAKLPPVSIAPGPKKLPNTRPDPKTPVAFIDTGVEYADTQRTTLAGALARQCGGLDAAAAALGFSGVSALQDAIRAFCEG
jgi:hypothetical protein